MAWIRYKSLNKIFDYELTHSQMIVLIGLSRYADENGENVYPSIKRLAYEVSYSERQVNRIFEQLRRKKILIPVGKRKAGNVVYRIAIENALLKKTFGEIEDYETNIDEAADEGEDEFIPN